MREKRVERHPDVITGKIIIVGKPSPEKIQTGRSVYEENLVKAVTGMGDDYDERPATAKLKAMHPGERELRMRTFIAQTYEEEGWELKVKAYEEVEKDLCEKYGLREPTDEEKIQAVRNPGNLSDNQKLALAKRFSHRVSKLRLAALVQLALRKTDNKKLDFKKFTNDEKIIIEKLLPGKGPLEERATHGELERVKYEFIEKFSTEGEYRVPYPSCNALYNNGNCGIETLRKVVRERKEAEILLEFMGKKVSKVKFREDLTLTKGKTSKDKHRINEDAYLSADIEYADGRKASFDAVFDGVGESEKAYMASGTAVEVFKLGMLLEPPQNEKDLEILTSMADIAIFLNRDEKVGMGNSSTTAAAVLTNGKKAYTVNAGDSKWIVFRNNNRHRQSVDHSIAEDLKRRGLLSREDTPDELSSVIASALGTGFTYLDSDSFNVKKGDVILVCSDGISDVVMPVEIENILSDNPVETAEKMIFDTAVERAENDKEYETPVNMYVWGKNDDKTLRIKKIE